MTEPTDAFTGEGDIQGGANIDSYQENPLVIRLIRLGRSWLLVMVNLVWEFGGGGGRF